MIKSLHLPAWFFTKGPSGLLYWQWAALLLSVLVGFTVGALLARLSRRVLMPLVKRTESTWDDALLERLSGPMTLGWALVIIKISVAYLELSKAADKFMDSVVRGAFFGAFFWTLGRLIDVGAQVMLTSAWGVTRPGATSVVTLGARVFKVVVLAMAVVALLSSLGYPVTSLLAGLGIGGLAVALAAQKTVENLFGAFSIGADQPFRVGDFVRVEDFNANVESIGLRSTKFRTLDRTMITLPNGKLAEMRIESYAARDRFRMHCVLGVVYGTTAAQMRQMLEAIERVLRAHPKIWDEEVLVRFRSFGASSLDIEVMAWFLVPSFAEFTVCRQDVLLQFMDVVEQAGSAFAFPTQTLHLVNDQVPLDAPSDRAQTHKVPSSAST